MSDDLPAVALAAIAEIRELLQAAYERARELERLVPPRRPLDKLSDHIQSVRASAEWMREEVDAASASGAQGRNRTGTAG